MLVLNRREGQAVILDGDIKVVVLSWDRRGVRLGIEAPEAKTILREELIQEVVAENERARAGDDTAALVARLPGLSPRAAPAPGGTPLP
ncbi:MAG TPA: carbon storage regulator [Gemmatimonadales bacterium]|jgi:carbon storage regulator|nr:carbon storage regulator [Gemmatimonadales bacterium]